MKEKFHLEEENRRLQNNLKNNELSIREVLATAPLGIAVTENRKILWVNDMLTQLSGYSSSELIGSNSRMLYPTDDAYRQAGKHVYNKEWKGNVFSVDSCLRQKNGNILDIRFFVSKLSAEKKNKIILIVQDITSEKKALDSLETNMDRLNRAQRVARIGNFEIDIASNEVWGSKMASYLFSEDTDRYTLNLASVLDKINEKDRAWIAGSINKLLRGEVKIFDDVFTTRNICEKKDLHIHLLAERIESEGKEKIVGTIQDITDQKKTEEDLIKKNNQLIQLFVENQRAKERLTQAQSVAKIGSWEYYPGQEIYKGTPETNKILGLTKDDPPVNMQNLLAYIIPGDRDRALKEMTDFLTSVTDSYSSTYTFFNKLDKKEITIHSIAEKKTDKQGRIIEVNGTVQDITDISAAEEKIRLNNIELQALNQELNATVEELEATNEEFEAQNEELIAAHEEIKTREQQYRSIVQDQTELILRCDTNGIITFANRAFSNYFKFDKETVEGKQFAPDIFRDDFQQVIDTFQSLSPDNPVKHIENRITMPDGTINWIQWTIRSFYDEKDNPLDFQFVGRDNTEQKHTEEELNRIATVIEQATEDIVITDIQGNIQYVNPSFENTTGYTKKEVIGKNPRILQSGNHTPEFYKELWQIITAGNVWKGQLINRKKNGDLVIQESVIFPLKDSQGVITGYAGIRRDITERVKLENQLLQIQKMEAIGTLAGGLAHDFNNILGGILGSTDMLKIVLKDQQLSSSDRINKYINTIQEASKRAAAMIKQLLTLSRKQDSELAQVDLNDAVRHVSEICSNSLPKSVNIFVEDYPEPCTVFADITQIEQVLLNLSVNASHAMTIMRGEDTQEGGKLTIGLEPFTSNKNFLQIHPDSEIGIKYWIIKVSDTGIGMDDSMRDRIFDPFFTTKSKENGTGLGLSMAYNIIHKHNGFIEVESTPGTGTTFLLYLPEYEEAHAPANEKNQTNELIFGTGTILVIDDEDIVRSITEGLLTEAGYKVILTESGKKGIEMFKKNAPSISAVLLDLSMPGMSGFETYKELRNLDSNIKVILASGYKHDERVSRLLEMGVLDFIQKPFSAFELTSSLKKILN